MTAWAYRTHEGARRSTMTTQTNRNLRQLADPKLHRIAVEGRLYEVMKLSIRIQQRNFSSAIKLLLLFLAVVVNEEEVNVAEASMFNRKENGAPAHCQEVVWLPVGLTVPILPTILLPTIRRLGTLRNPATHRRPKCLVEEREAIVFPNQKVNRTVWLHIRSHFQPLRGCCSTWFQFESLPHRWRYRPRKNNRTTHHVLTMKHV